MRFRSPAEGASISRFRSKAGPGLGRLAGGFAEFMLKQYKMGFEVRSESSFEISAPDVSFEAKAPRFSAAAKFFMVSSRSLALGAFALVSFSNLGRAFSTVSRSLSASSVSRMAMSRSGSDLPSTWMTLSSSKARTTSKIASTSRMWERNLFPSPSPSAAPFTSPAISTNSPTAGTIGFHSEKKTAYDIRGLYPQELDENAAALIAAGFAEYLRRRGSGRRVLIGRDVRWSSQELGEALKERLCALGAEVVDIGLATTPMFTFAMYEARSDFGFMVTASHNPVSYNGFKLYEKTRTLSEKSGLGEIRELAARGEFGILSERRGSFEKKDFLESYVKFLLSQVRLPKKIRAVFDAGGGATAMVLPELLKKEKNIQATVLFKDLDPALARRHPDPLAPGASEFAREAVLRQEAEVGFVFDIDGDRVVVLNERGEAVRPDAVLWLLSQELSQGEGVVFDIRSSRALREDLEERRLRALPSRVGHSFIK